MIDKTYPANFVLDNIISVMTGLNRQDFQITEKTLCMSTLQEKVFFLLISQKHTSGFQEPQRHSICQRDAWTCPINQQDLTYQELKTALIESPS